MRHVVRAAPAALLLASLSVLLFAGGAETVPLYAARNGMQCQTCHFDPNGGGPRNGFGFLFARNRHTLVPEAEGTPWRDVELTNRIGEAMPVFVSINHRFMMLATHTKRIEGPDRFGFFNMENALHLAFQPHERLTMVYTRDGLDGGASSQEAFGMLGGLPGNGYLKAGRFTNPFGLRMDDHTVATRNSFLDFLVVPGPRPRFLPLDPRQPDMGIEYGMGVGGWFGSAAFTNGAASVLAGQYAETKAASLGYNAPGYQGAVSLYDGVNKIPVGNVRRATRWGYYGMTHRGPVALLGEVAAGTDEVRPRPGAPFDKRNLLALFAEVDYAPARWLNLRLRYDRLETDRSSDREVRDTNTHQRYAFETEYVPVAFAELRGTVRRIDHKRHDLAGREDETQAYLQFHFSY